MLYIEFKILDAEKFIDFQKLYLHMVKLRDPGFELKEEDEFDGVDWATITDEEFKLVLQRDPPEKRRYKELFPDYANAFLEKYLQFDNSHFGPLGILDVFSILKYLEYGFDVDLDSLKKLNEHFGRVDFSAGNYPYGGMERFLMVLKAFDLIPAECFNGFVVYEFDWISEFEHNSIELPEKTKEYFKIIELKKAEAYAELKKKQDKEQFNKELRDEPEIPKLSLWELIIIIILIAMLVYQYFTIARKFI